MARKKTTTRTRKEPSLEDLADLASRARLARVSRFSLKDPMEIEYGDSRGRVSEEPTRCGEGAASFQVR
jgi:hypothetical protein